MTAKITLRKQFRRLRDDIPKAYHAKAARKANEILLKQGLFRHSENIASYLPFKNEFDTYPIMQSIWQAKKNCFVPVLSESSQILQFVLFTPGDALHPNRFGILEPINRSRILTAADLDFVLVPLLAFDRQGHRLGTGGGFYDHTFAFLHQAHYHLEKPYLVGVGFANQEQDKLPADAWDVPLRAILTEQAYIPITL